MSRIAPLNPETATGEAADLFGAVKSKFGMVPNLLKTVGHEPSVLKGYLDFSGALGGASFDANTREAIALTVAGANGCDYCASAHTAASKMMKVDQDEITRRLGGTSDDAKLNTLLNFARQVVETRGFVEDADLQAVRDTGYTDAQVVELVGNVVVNIFTNYINHVADTEIDFPKVSAKSFTAQEAA